MASGVVRRSPGDPAGPRRLVIRRPPTSMLARRSSAASLFRQPRHERPYSARVDPEVSDAHARQRADVDPAARLAGRRDLDHDVVVEPEPERPVRRLDPIGIGIGRQKLPTQPPYRVESPPERVGRLDRQCYRSKVRIGGALLLGELRAAVVGATRRISGTAATNAGGSSVSVVTSWIGGAPPADTSVVTGTMPTTTAPARAAHAVRSCRPLPRTIRTPRTTALAVRTSNPATRSSSAGPSGASPTR